MAVYTQISSNDIILTQENNKFSVWDGRQVDEPFDNISSQYIGGFNNGIDLPVGGDTFTADAGNQGYTERKLGITEVYGYILYDRPRETRQDSRYTAEPQLNITHGNKNGSGSFLCNVNESAQKSAISRMIYGQYRSLIYGDENTNFKFNGYEADSIIIFNLYRRNYKQALIPEDLTWTIGYTPQTFTAFCKSSTSNDFEIKPPKLTRLGRQYDLVSGSNGIISGNTLNQASDGSKGSYGLVYPDAGIIIFNNDALVADGTPGFYSNLVEVNNELTSENTSQNDQLDKISTALKRSTTKLICNAEETLFSQNYLIRIPNEAYNYTNNQSFVDAKGKVKNLSFVDNPITYITTIGLYNDQNELIAVAKLSKPILKDFSKELFIKVKLDF